jgi:hypothetical protein
MAILWIVLAATVLFLIACRWWIAKDEDDTLHLRGSEVGLVSRQSATARKLEYVDHWGKILTVVALAYGLVIVSAAMYRAWVTL